ncbi:unnamed protein product, partial [Callosobruchus maculatus]
KITRKNRQLEHLFSFSGQFSFYLCVWVQLQFVVQLHQVCSNLSVLIIFVPTYSIHLSQPPASSIYNRVLIIVKEFLMQRTDAKFESLK